MKDESMPQWAKLVLSWAVGFWVASMLFGHILPWVNPMPTFAQEAAVKAGKAEYYLDADNNRQWRWKP